MDINTASAEDLQEILGIDEERAKAIIEYRAENGEFTDWDEVEEVPGFDHDLVEKLQDAGATIGSSSPA